MRQATQITLAGYEKMLEVCCEFMGHIALKKIRPMTIEELSSFLRKREVRGRRITEQTVKKYLNAVSVVLEDAKRNDIIRANPVRMVKLAPLEKPEQVIPSREEMGRLLEAFRQEKPLYRAFFLLSVTTGMRRGECCGLRWSDIDWSERSIHIQRNVVKLTGEEIFVKEPKTASGNRYVYFSPEMGRLLREYRSFCREEARAYEDRELTHGDYLFRRRDTDLPMTPTTFTWRFKLILTKHGLPQDLNVHSLRHTVASLMISNGTDAATVAGILGHAQVSTTLDIYTHAFDSKKKEASRALQESLDL